MLEIAQLKDRKEEIIERLKVRNFDGAAQIESVLEIDDKRKSTQGDLDNLLAQINSSSKEIGELFKSGKTDEANKLKENIPTLKDETKKLGESLTQLESEIKDILLGIPNCPNELVPSGKTSDFETFYNLFFSIL